MRPLLVGESNPYSVDQRNALLPWPAQAAGNRLRMILELTDREYLRAFDRANLVLGHRWSLRAARDGAAYLLRQRPIGTFVLLGRRVAQAFGYRDEPFSVLQSQAPGTDHVFYLLPHPSGRCREWNRPGAAERARRLLANFLPTHGLVDGGDVGAPSPASAKGSGHG